MDTLSQSELARVTRTTIADVARIARNVPAELVTLDGQRCRLVKELNGKQEVLDETDIRELIFRQIHG